MRVLTVLPCRFWGGPEKQTLQLALWLRDNASVDTAVAVMLPNVESPWENPLVARAREAGLQVTTFRQKRRYDILEGIRLLRELVSRHRPDVVCATGYKADVLTSWLPDVPTIAVLRGWTSESRKVRFFEWLDRKSLRRHDAIMVVSKALGEEAVREGAAPEKVFWVPNSIDLSRLPPRRRREDLCTEIGADSQRPIVGSVGRLSPEKGHRVLLDAFQPMQRRIPGARLVLVGDGPEEPALRQQADELGLSSNVTFLGLRRDGQQIIGALDLLVLPSFTEGMPNVVLEAFAYDTPVVATAVGGVPDMVTNDSSGWLVPAGDSARLAEAMVEAVQNRREAGRRARQARATLTETFTVERQAQAWLKATGAVVGSKSPGGPGRASS